MLSCMNFYQGVQKVLSCHLLANYAALTARQVAFGLLSHGACEEQTLWFQTGRA